MDIRTLIPKNKGDDESIDELKKLSFEEIEPIVPDLLIWIQDINWPISGDIADLLTPFIDKIIPDIIKILRSDDPLWKLWTLTLLARRTTNPVLLKEIKRIAEFPTPNEISEEVNIEAIAILNGEYR